MCVWDRIGFALWSFQFNGLPEVEKAIGKGSLFRRTRTAEGSSTQGCKYCSPFSYTGQQQDKDLACQCSKLDRTHCLGKSSSPRIYSRTKHHGRKQKHRRKVSTQENENTKCGREEDKVNNCLIQKAEKFFILPELYFSGLYLL